jgi:hypothetical protein
VTRHSEQDGGSGVLGGMSRHFGQHPVWGPNEA